MLFFNVQIIVFYVYVNVYLTLQHILHYCTSAVVASNEIHANISLHIFFFFLFFTSFSLLEPIPASSYSIPSCHFLSFPSLGDGLSFPLTHQNCLESGFSQQPSGNRFGDGAFYYPQQPPPNLNLNQYDSIALSQPSQPQMVG